MCGIFSCLIRLDSRFGPFGLFTVFYSTFDLISDSASKMCRRLGIDDVSIASRKISLRSVRGTLVCFIRGVNVYGHMSHSSVFPGRQILVGAHPSIYRVSQKFVPLLYKSVFQYDWTW